MSVKRFVGNNSRDAMRRVREALGDDALILANRPVPEGVEILAMADAEAERLTTRDDPPTPPEPSAPAADFAALGTQLLSEMQEMRELLRRPAATPGEDSTAARLVQQLLNAGFGHQLASELACSLPLELVTAAWDGPECQDWLRRRLMARLTVTDGHTDPLDAGGVVALVGPTGVGKTTTTAKLAARQVMRSGADTVALVSTDSYRIGAHEQLRIYAELLGVSLHTIDRAAALQEVLPTLADKRLVIIDTVGMSQRDQRLVHQLQSLQTSGRPVRLLLLLNAASQGETLDEVITTYRQTAHAAGSRLADVMLTKQDEAARLGPVLDVVMRHGLQLHFVSHGQQVPEDLSRADPEALCRLALTTAGESPASSWSAPASVPKLSAMSRQLLGQGRAISSLWQALRLNASGFAALEAGWRLNQLPAPLQPAQLETLALDTAPGGPLLWAKRGAARGQDWAMPDVWLDAAGHPAGLPLLQHRQPAGWPERLEWARALGADTHLLPSLPDTATRHWLNHHAQSWVSQASGSNRVWHAGTRHSLNALASLAVIQTTLSIHYQGRRATLQLACLPLDGDSRHASSSCADQGLQAWFGHLVDSDSDTPLGRRFWLAPRTARHDALTILECLPTLDSLPTLTRRAHKALAGAGLDTAASEWRLGVSAGLAGLACQLAMQEAPWAMDIRGQLLSLRGGQRRRTPQTLLDSLIHLFLARDSLCQAGASLAGGQHDGA